MTLTQAQLDTLEEKCKAVAAAIGYMKSKPGEDDYCMFVNEIRSGGGFEWKFLDFEPEDIENYRRIYISLLEPDSPDVIASLVREVKMQRELLERAKKMIGIDLVNYDEDEGDQWFSDYASLKGEGTGAG